MSHGDHKIVLKLQKMLGHFNVSIIDKVTIVKVDANLKFRDIALRFR